MSNKINALVQSINSSPYAPTREQLVQLLTVLLTLALMMLMGPAAGPMVAAAVRQVVPVLVAMSVDYAQQRAIDGPPAGPEPDITRIPLHPVEARHSLFGKTL